jgi:hypothetical protein
VFWFINFFVAGFVSGTTLFMWTVKRVGGYETAFTAMPELERSYRFLVPLGVGIAALNIVVGQMFR